MMGSMDSARAMLALGKALPGLEVGAPWGLRLGRRVET